MAEEAAFLEIVVVAAVAAVAAGILLVGAVVPAFVPVPVEAAYVD